MDWWGEVRLALQGFLDQHGVLAGFVLVLIEEAGVPVPVPGDFLMLALGVHARQGHVQLWQALLVLQIATLLELKDENPFKIRAYANAARSIETWGGNLSD